MRSPRHLAITGLVVGALVVAIGLVVARLSGADQPPGAAPASSSSSQVPSLAPARPSSTAAGASTTTAAPSSLPVPTPTSAPADPKALETAVLWAKSWVNHAQPMTNEQWLDALRPYTTEEQLALMSTVNLANIRATAVTGEPVAKTSYASSVDVVVPTNAGALSITVIATPQGWRVAHYEEA